MKVLSLEHPATFCRIEHLAWVIREEGQAAEAEQLCSAVLDIRKRLLGPEHEDTLQRRFDFCQRADQKNYQWLLVLESSHSYFGLRPHHHFQDPTPPLSGPHQSITMPLL